MEQISFRQLQQWQKQLGPDFILRAQQQVGDLFAVKIPFFPRLFFALHPTHAHTLLVKQAAKIEKPHLILRAIQSSFGNGLFTSRGEQWRRQRKLMQPPFQHARIAHYAERMSQHTQTMLAGWQNGNLITLDEAMHALTFTIVVDALFSANATGETAHISQAMHDLGQGLAAQGLSIGLTLLPDSFPHPVLRQKRRGARELKRAVTELMQQRQQIGEANSPADLLSTLMFTRDAETGEQMNKTQVQDELVTLFIAGHETTAVLLQWVWVLLDKHPQTAQQLYAELQQVLNGRPPTVADLPNLPYTAAIIKESLRLYPPAWFLFRQTVEPVELDGQTIPTNSILFLLPYATHRDPRWYTRPTQFEPERWQNGLEHQLPKGAYFPFGLGPRICIGNGFAQMEAQLLLATIAQQYALELLDEPATIPGAATLGFARPVRVRLHHR